jgi:hypothetical protein
MRGVKNGMGWKTGYWGGAASAFAIASTFAKATADKTADKMADRATGPTGKAYGLEGAGGR